MDISDRKNLLLDQIRRMATQQQLRQMPDSELLAQFAGQGNEAAFRVLMDRYGPMVLRVCKRILGNDHDAEDAYQAVFSSWRARPARNTGKSRCHLGCTALPYAPRASHAVLTSVAVYANRRRWKRKPSILPRTCRCGRRAVS